MRSVVASTKNEPPSGSIVLATPDSSARICCVRSAIVTAACEGSASASSTALVWGVGGGQADPGCLGGEAHQPRARVGGGEGVAHLVGPDATGGAVLADLFEEVVMGIEEEGQTRGEGVERQAAGPAPADIIP